MIAHKVSSRSIFGIDTSIRSRRAPAWSKVLAIPSHTLLRHCEDTTSYQCDGLAYWECPLVLSCLVQLFSRKPVEAIG